jgi:predicted nucleic acid-binding protein
MIKDYPDKMRHEACLALLERGLRGELDYVLAVNPIIIIEVFSVLRRLLSCDEAAFRVSSLLRSRRLGFLLISKQECQNSVRWAKEKNIPINDAIIGAGVAEYGQPVYTVDEEHFKKLEEYNVKIINPTMSTF